MRVLVTHPREGTEKVNNSAEGTVDKDLPQ
jgi:hypothetical protein